MRQRQACGDQGGAHALARLRHRLVRQAHDIERGQSGRHLHLDIDGARLDALECHRRDPLDHVSPCSAARVARATIPIKNISRTNAISPV